MHACWPYKMLKPSGMADRYDSVYLCIQIYLWGGCPPNAQNAFFTHFKKVYGVQHLKEKKVDLHDHVITCTPTILHDLSVKKVLQSCMIKLQILMQVKAYIILFCVYARNLKKKCTHTFRAALSCLFFNKLHIVTATWCFSFFEKKNASPFRPLHASSIPRDAQIHIILFLEDVKSIKADSLAYEERKKKERKWWPVYDLVNHRSIFYRKPIYIVMDQNSIDNITVEPDSESVLRDNNLTPLRRNRRT